MGEWDVKRRLWSQQLFQLGLSVIVLHLFLASGSFINCKDVYRPPALEALQKIFGAWNTSTPDLNKTLAGWSSTQEERCSSQSSAHATIPKVQCLTTGPVADTEDTWSVEIIGLFLSNASIVGTFPPEVGNISSLTLLELTGNPRLTGPLPGSLQDTWLNVLDIHDNGFTGHIPNLTRLWNLLQLDLSGNNFTGGFPSSQLSTMDYLQILSIGDNALTGEIPDDTFTNKMELEKLDISNNLFNGTLPDLNPMQKYLNYLDVSGNQFEGQLPDLSNLSTLRTVRPKGEGPSERGRITRGSVVEIMDCGDGEEGLVVGVGKVINLEGSNFHGVAIPESCVTIEVTKSNDDDYLLYEPVNMDDLPITNMGQAVNNYILWPLECLKQAVELA